MKKGNKNRAMTSGLKVQVGNKAFWILKKKIAVGCYEGRRKETKDKNYYYTTEAINVIF